VRATAAAALAVEKVRQGEPLAGQAARERDGPELAALELGARGGHLAQSLPAPNQHGTAPRELTGRNSQSADRRPAGLTGPGLASRDLIRREPADSRPHRRLAQASSGQTTHDRRDRGLSVLAELGQGDLDAAGNDLQDRHVRRELKGPASRTSLPAVARSQAAARPGQAGHSEEHVRQARQDPAAAPTAEHVRIQGEQTERARLVTPDGSQNPASMERESPRLERDRAAQGRGRRQKAAHGAPKGNQAPVRVESGQAENDIERGRRLSIYQFRAGTRDAATAPFNSTQAQSVAWVAGLKLQRKTLINLIWKHPRVTQLIPTRKRTLFLFILMC
jgi:hypothetical protein